ncbi:hypothetical protein FQR65_LT11423 [Abscondita terminalis]|nr:hypothetical protein FQR65_LT11423 [Abscondita terminalis]
MKESQVNKDKRVTNSEIAELVLEFLGSNDKDAAPWFQQGTVKDVHKVTSDSDIMDIILASKYDLPSDPVKRFIKFKKWKNILHTPHLLNSHLIMSKKMESNIAKNDDNAVNMSAKCNRLWAKIMEKIVLPNTLFLL